MDESEKTLKIIRHPWMKARKTLKIIRHPWMKARKR